MQTVMDCEYDSRKELYANIVVSGGTSLLKNFPDRLKQEVLTQHSLPDRSVTAGIIGTLHTATFCVCNAREAELCLVWWFGRSCELV